MDKKTKIIWGAVIIIAGVLLALYQFDVLTWNIFFDGWWALFIIVPCLIEVCCKKNIVGNLIGVGIGVTLLLIAQEVISYSLIEKLWLPALIVCIGIAVIFSKKKPDYSEEIDEVKAENEQIPDGQSKKLNGFAAFSGAKYKATGEKVFGGELTAVFGGVDYDLQNAVFEGKTVIDVCALFGGVDLRLPENVIVKVKPFSVFGGVSDKRNSQAVTETEDVPVVYVNAFTMFGGVTIK